MANAILRQQEVTKRLGISSSTLWYRLDPKNRRHDPDMPRPFKLSGSGNAIGWLESEIDDTISPNKRQTVSKGPNHEKRNRPKRTKHFRRHQPP